MSLLKSIKNLVGIEEVDEISEDEVQEAMANLSKKQNSFEAKSPDYKPPAHDPDYKREHKVSSAQELKPPQSLSQVSKQTTTGGTNPFKLVVLEPKGFEECPKLVDSLKGRKPVILNLEKLESDTARKIFDFMSGATYALNGNVQKVANNIFVFAPENVDITANIDHKSIDFGGNQKSIWR